MNRPTYSARLPLFVGFSALTFLILGLGVWSVRTEIAGAIIASGTIVVENNRQVIQHAEGGVVGTVQARDGDPVAAGDLLLRLDDTMLKSEMAVADLQLIELRARKARLQAERDEAQDIVFPEILLALTSEAATEQINGQRKLFEARRISLETERNQIIEQIKQTHNQIEGANAQLAALAIQEELVGAYLADQESLLERGLVQSQRVSTLRRDAAQIAGEIGSLTASVAQFRGQIAALEIELLRLVTSRQENSITELRDIQFNELELTEQHRTLAERMSRLDIRAPVGGIVYGSSVFAEKAVVQSAEPLMFVIPQDQPLIISARVEAIHVDQVHVGQEATLKFSAFNQRTTPELIGRVISVSADVFEDENSGISFYRVDLEPLEEELTKLDALEILPGMPVEAFIKTDDRTPLSYLTKPLTDYFGRALRGS
ncbi:HlyD family type I secretion periplasmic adaptor subunit [Rhodobacteraceae bacterium]|nr:HlyD family type I secretion periplasmic adaptor subunit [Paracoccaceae bacterium]